MLKMSLGGILHLAQFKVRISTDFFRIANQSLILKGLGQFFTTKELLSKLYWITIFLVFSVATIQALVKSFPEYLKHPVITQVSYVQNNSLNFPSVTICSANRVHCGNLQKYIEECDKVEI